MLELGTILLTRSFLRKGNIEDTRRNSKDLIHSARLGDFSSRVAKYTSSVDIDSKILEATIEVNLAHVLMLLEQKLISASIASDLLSALNTFPKKMALNPQLEDIHMNLEDWVISRTGIEAGGMLNLGKSRNDQVGTAIRMALRRELVVIAKQIISFDETMLSKALENAPNLMPGYTHLQRAQPVTVGHHLLAHVGALERNLDRVFDCYSRVNRCPMGAGALATNSFSLDRAKIAHLLGFDGLVENSMDAVSARDFAIEAIYVCAQVMSDLSRLAEEIVLWTSKEFSFATISDSFAATSSMMPQKKNAIVPEIARAKAAQVAGDLVSALGVVKALPLSYNLDLQELTRSLWSALEKTRETLELFPQLVKELNFHAKALKNAVVEDETLFATELADYLVAKYGIPFREAHSRVGALIRRAEAGSFLEKAFSNLSEQELSDNLGVPIGRDELAQILDPQKVLSRRKSLGSPNPDLVTQSILNHRARLSKKKTELQKLIEKDRLATGGTYAEVEKTVDYSRKARQRRSNLKNAGR